MKPSLMQKSAKLYKFKLLAAILAQPPFENRVSAAQFNPTDLEMAYFIQLAYFLNPDFWIVSHAGVQLLVRKHSIVE